MHNACMQAYHKRRFELYVNPMWDTCGAHVSMRNFILKNPHGNHMGPISLVCVGPGWESPTGAHVCFIWDTAPCSPMWDTCGPHVSMPNFILQKSTWKPYGAHICWSVCGLRMGKPDWGPSGYSPAGPCPILSFNNPHGNHMGLYLLVCVGPGWESPTGAHVCFIWDIIWPQSAHRKPRWAPDILLTGRRSSCVPHSTN